jgi:hypothetical protein
LRVCSTDLAAGSGAFSFGDPAGVIAALSVGLECLGRQGSSNELAQMSSMVEGVDRLALLS